MSYLVVIESGSGRTKIGMEQQFEFLLVPHKPCRFQFIYLTLQPIRIDLKSNAELHLMQNSLKSYIFQKNSWKNVKTIGEGLSPFPLKFVCILGNIKIRFSLDCSFMNAAKSYVQCSNSTINIVMKANKRLIFTTFCLLVFTGSLLSHLFFVISFSSSKWTV